MMRIATYKDLAKARTKYKPLMTLREEGAQKTPDKRELLICGGTGCQSSASKDLLAALQKQIKAAKLDKNVTAGITGCFGFCEKGPIVKVFPDDVFYVEVTPEDAQEIVKSHLIDNVVVRRL
ncbi:(2Fe-2S) ferredoxin domain-containing protein, partial [Desulfovibrio sp. OttesenSCG-928-F20]|nr:(2Fe-2S) ferredoxin domain-containing protein [Desulfovibrio sp. OttesenSCG-928-F20]